MISGLVAVLSAALFGLNNAVTRRGVLLGTVMQGLAITVPMGVVLFALTCLLTGSLGHVFAFPALSYVWLALAGFSHFVFGRYCNYRAISAIGTNLASPIQQWELLVTLVLALVFLGERLTGLALVAIGLLLLGPAIAARMEAHSRSAAPPVAPPVTPSVTPKFTPRYREGYFFAFLSIFGYGASPILIRAGLDNAGVGASMAAGLVSYIAATIIVAIWIVVTRQTEHVCATGREPMRWFALAGLLVFLSQVARYMALALLPASVVAPILRLQTLFRIYFSWLITREYEVFDRHVMIGTLVSLAGALLISLPTDAVMAWLPLPTWLKSVLAARWI